MQDSFLSYFRTMEDHRKDRKKLHSLETIIAITIVAVICRCETWSEIAMFGKCRKDFFSKFLDLKNGTPSKDTIRRFFKVLDPKVFEEHFIDWVRSLVKVMDDEYVGIDGKTVRQASRMSGTSLIHIVSAWAGKKEMVLGQVKTDNKSNEITAIPQLLDVLYLKGSTVTIDAMGCQKKIAEKIIDKQAGYVLSVKDNHPNLLEDIKLSFEKKACDDYYETLDSGHGRIEERKCSVIRDLNSLLDKDSWKGLRSIVRIEAKRTIKKTGEIQEETRYYISSKKSAEVNSQAIRHHWGIENKLHWSLDMTYGEDASSKRTGFSAQNFSIINKIVLNIMSKDKDNKRFKIKTSVKSKRLLANWDHEYLMELLHLL